MLLELTNCSAHRCSRVYCARFTPDRHTGLTNREARATRARAQPYEKIVSWSIIAGEGEREKENKSDMRKEERQGIQNKVKWIERKMEREERKEKYVM